MKEMKPSRHLVGVVIGLAVFFGLEHGIGNAKAVKDTKSLCLECHSKIAELTNRSTVHRPVRDGQCTSCHNPHA